MRGRAILEEIRELRIGSNETSAEIRELRSEMRDLRSEIRDLHSENRDLLRFTNELIRRNEVAFRDMTGVLGALREGSRTAVEETRAQTRAIFLLIDRLGGAGPAPAT